MRLAVKLGFLALVLAPVAALGDNAPTVVLATPGAENGAIQRFTIRFSQPMVALGNRPAPPRPMTGECAVAGTRPLGRPADLCRGIRHRPARRHALYLHAQVHAAQRRRLCRGD